MERLFHAVESDEDKFLPDGRLGPEIDKCPYCFHWVANATNYASPTMQEDMNLDFRFCPRCGWWDVRTSADHGFFGPRSVEGYHFAVLRDLRDDEEVSIATQMLINEIATKPDRIWSISPRQFEEIVASLFANTFDCKVELTKQSRDDGRDLICFDSNGGKFIVEVKRYAKSRSIGVGIVRNLLGAMVLDDVHRGFIVTTSTFSRDAEKLQKKLAAKGTWHLEYHDLEQLTDWLRLSFRKCFDVSVLNDIVTRIAGTDDNMGFPREFSARGGGIIKISVG